MKAAVWTKYGTPEVINIQDITKPVPKDNQVLIKVRAASVSKADCEMLNLDFSPVLKFLMRLIVGLRKPKRIRVLGQELSGVIEAIGKSITKFKIGDEVIVSTGIKHGGHAEYICLSEKGEGRLITIKPENISFEKAASIASSGIEAFCFLKRAELEREQKVLIIGAGGSFGTYAIQIAKYFDTEVTAVDSGPKSDMLKKIGADRFIDYTTIDYTAQEVKYDVVFDIVCKEKYSKIKNILCPNGVYIAGNPKAGDLLRSFKKRRYNRIFVIPNSGKHTSEDLEYLIELIKKQIIIPVIDTVYIFDQIVEAFNYAVSGNKKGNIIVSCS